MDASTNIFPSAPQTQTQSQASGTKPTRPGLSGTRIATIVVGAVFVFGGIAVGALGGGLLALFGGDATVSSGNHALTTHSTALVSDVANIEDTSDFADVVGEPRVRLSLESTPAAKNTFVGIAPAADVDRYLAKAPIDEVSDFDVDPFVLDRSPRAGSVRPAPPADQKFWVAQGTSRDSAALNWKVEDGDYRMVVMNADGSRGVETAGSIGLEVPHLPTIAWVLMGTGFFFLLSGGVAITAALAAGRGENG